MSHLKFKGLCRRKAEPKQHKFGTFDIESSAWVNCLGIGFYDGDSYEYFERIEDMLDHCLRSKYRNYRFYAHYGGKYDFLFILKELGIAYELIEISGHILEIKVGFNKYVNRQGKTQYKNCIYFRDTFRLMPAALKKLTDTFDVEHKKLDFDVSNLKTMTPEAKRYLKNDVMGLYEVIEKFTRQITDLGGEVKTTIAATSLDIFCRRFIPKDMFIQNYPDHEDFVRKGYYGGRVEVFKKYYFGNGLNCYDFNSLYPAMMRDNIFPIGKPTLHEKWNYQPGKIGMVEIEAIIPFMDKPPLPVHTTTGMMLFPYGHIKGIYPMPFLHKLKDMGIDFITHRFLEFGGAMIFTDFVDTLYKLRMKNNDNTLGYICKLILNSLYGKFAQRRERRRYIINPDIHHFEKDLFNYNVDLDIWFEEIRSESNHILPAISAYVTAYAQLHLYSALENYRVFYCDTDSIFTPDVIETGGCLGELKLEYSAREAIFLTQKLYALKLDDERELFKAKGFPIKKENGEQNFTFNDFERALFNMDYGGFIHDTDSIFSNKSKSAVYGFKESILKGNGFLSYGERKKSIRNIDTKRHFHKFSSIPFESQLESIS